VAPANGFIVFEDNVILQIFEVLVLLLLPNFAPLRIIIKVSGAFAAIDNESWHGPRYH
jgi:competence protein ComGC